jgi:hypothetical protein
MERNLLAALILRQLPLLSRRPQIPACVKICFTIDHLSRHIEGTVNFQGAAKYQ